MPSNRNLDKWLAHAVIAGFCATVVMLVVALNAFGICSILAHSESASMGQSWIGALTANPLVDTTRDFLYGSLALHLTVGLVWAVVYAAWFEARLSGPGWWRGMQFSLLPWILSLVVFLPLAGGGFLGLALGAGPLPIIGNFILHLCYGATLGVVYAPLGKLASTDTVGPVNGLGRTEVVAAKGLLVGLALGLAVGVAGLCFARAETWHVVLGLPPGWYVLATTAAGGSLGLLVGSLVGLPTSSTSMKGI